MKSLNKHKHCTGCKTSKPESMFNKNKSSRDGLQNYCKPCKARATTNWRNGIGTGFFEEMKIKQNDKCAICEKVSAVLVIDHCHLTNKIRSLLCRRCNGMLGMADENKLILERAISYIDLWTEE